MQLFLSETRSEWLLVVVIIREQMHRASADFLSILFMKTFIIFKTIEILFSI